MPPRIAVRDISFFERPIPFAKPFRFGSVVITSSVQVFVRAAIEIEGKGASIGASAEMMASKWFEKRAHLSPQQTVDNLVAPMIQLPVGQRLIVDAQGPSVGPRLNPPMECIGDQCMHRRPPVTRGRGALGTLGGSATIDLAWRPGDV